MVTFVFILVLRVKGYFKKKFYIRHTKITHNKKQICTKQSEKTYYNLKYIYFYSEKFCEIY